MSAPADGAAPKPPLQNFADCHASIVARLCELARLPRLIEPAREARRVAGATVAFFRGVVHEHHAEEEVELFPAVLAAAHDGDEHEEISRIVERLTSEHRRIEGLWKRLLPAVEAIATGTETPVDGEQLTALVDAYLEHALCEEEVFLPLSQRILSRRGERMAALGLALHERHAAAELGEGRFAT